MELFKKIKYSLLTVILLTIFNICCTKKKNTVFSNQQNSYLGDSTLSEKNYFKTLVHGDTYSILNKKNEKYKKFYSTYDENRISLPNDISIKIIDEKLCSKDNLKINLYTFNKNKKIDSIRFYRNISGKNYEKYNCLSFFDKKNNKIWQINYFPSDFEKSVNIISYLEMSIKPDGTIKKDSLRYLDESLEVIMQDNNLYY